VCGSRQFRTCCFNYIKKRSDPAIAPFGGHGSDDSGRISSNLVKAGGTSTVSERQPSKHLRRSVGGEIVGLSNDMAVPEYAEDQRWLYSYLAGDAYKF